MANGDNKWYFSKERLENSPSRRCGIEKYKELSYRQRAANFIQDLGQKLKVNQLCVNTAIVYMHRFYVFHSFTHFPWVSIASASIFLAAKVEEQPRKLEHVIQYANFCQKRHDTRFEVSSRRYQAQAQDLVFNENVLLQTLGFDVVIHHPHTYAIKGSQLIIATKNLAQTSYFMASYSLHLTTLCLQYKPKVVACFCIHLACKRLNYEFLLSRDNRGWFTSVDSTVTVDLLNQMTEEYLPIFEKCPPTLKEKVMEMGGCFPFESEKKLAITPDIKNHRQHHDNSKPGPANITHKPHNDSTSSSSGQPAFDSVYREKREVESMTWHLWSKPIASNPASQKGAPHGHHGGLVDSTLKQHNRPSSPNRIPVRSRADLNKALLRVASISDKRLKDYREQSRDLTDGSCDIKMLSNGDNSGREFQIRTSDKELQQHQRQQQHQQQEEQQKRDGDSYVFFSNNSNNINNSPSSINRTESSSGHYHDDVKQHKTRVNGIKKHLSSVGGYDKTSAPSVLNHSMNTTTRKMESPLTIPAGTSKSVPKIKSSSITVDLLCDPSIGIEVTHAVPDMITPISDQLEEIHNEMKPPYLISPFANDAMSREPSQAIVKGVETNATLISDLLRDTHTVSHLPSIASSAENVAVKGQEDKNHHRKERKKKKKHEEKHKHKGKDRNKKKKHKDKDRREKDKDKKREKVKQAAPAPAPLPIKITISKDKIQLDPAVIGGGLQINIRKDRLKADAVSNDPPQITPLKIKIPKDVINNYIGESRKRDGDKTSPRDAPPAKMSKSSHNHSSDSKQNGRNSLCCSSM